MLRMVDPFDAGAAPRAAQGSSRPRDGVAEGSWGCARAPAETGAHGEIRAREARARSAARRRARVCSLALTAATSLALLGLAAGLEGCRDATTEGEETPDASVADGGAHVEVLHPDAPPLPGQGSCEVTITTGIPVGRVKHVPFCVPIEYPTNPPSGGHHWGTWAAFRTYDEPLPREMYVHNLEHGAIVLAYRCEGACPEVVDFLEDVKADAADDPACSPQQGMPRVRILTTPDPKLAAPVAAAAWGATYVATCLDAESLGAFIAENIGHGPEAVCVDGKDPFDPAVGLPSCDGGVDAAQEDTRGE